MNYNLPYAYPKLMSMELIMTCWHGRGGKGREGKGKTQEKKFKGTVSKYYPVYVYA